MGSLRSSLRKVSIRSTMFLCYLFAGAGIFMGLEKEASLNDLERERRDYERAVNEFKLTHNISNETFTIFEQIMTRAYKYDVFKNEDPTNLWSFASAFFFCGNVITTIGYGTIVPKTALGQVIMMFYALLGIPLTGFFLRTVGNEMTSLIAYIVKYYERRVLNREAEKLELKCALVAMVLALFMLILGATIFHTSENGWNYLDAFYFCFVTLTTIGFGDLVPGQASNVGNDAARLGVEMASLVYYVLGLSIMSGVIVSISGVIEEKTKKLDVSDPMDAIRNLRIENLNSKAMKKLGYKVDEGIMFPPTMKEGRMVNRRGTIVPDTDNPGKKFGTLGSGLPNLPKKNTSSEDHNENIIQNGHLKPQDNKNPELKVIVDITPTPSLSTSPILPPRKNNPKSKQSESKKSESKEPNTSDKTRTEPVIRIFSADETESERLNTTNDVDEVIANNSTETTHVQNTTHDGNKRIGNGGHHSKKTKRTYSDPHLKLNTRTVPDGNRTFLQNLSIDSSSNKLFQKLQYSYNNTNLRQLQNQKHETKHSSKDTQKAFKHHKTNNNNKRKDQNCTLGSAGVTKSQRIGLPAELFANHVSISLNTAEESNELKMRDNNTFYRIPQTSPLKGYSNPCYHSDTPPLATWPLDVKETTQVKNSLERRRSSTGGFSAC